jgi:hypothetical protein
MGRAGVRSRLGEPRCGRRAGRRSTSEACSGSFWRRIADGMPSEEAAVACGVSTPVGTRWFRDGGGMPSISLAEPSGRYLSFADREEIAILKARDCGVREIARRLTRHPSTISRELRRNAATRCGKLEYRASTAQWKAERAARRPKVARLAANDRLRAYVQDRLAGAITDADGRPIPGPNVPWKGRRHGRRADRRWGVAWSPEQISRRLRTAPTKNGPALAGRGAAAIRDAIVDQIRRPARAPAALADLGPRR